MPIAQAWSAMVFSIRLIVTLPPVRSSPIDSTHAASHGAGHSRPVNSGKLLVACSRSLAASHRPRRTRSFHSGIRLPSGQPAVPEWQNGIPQSMQRRACWETSAGAVLRALPLVDLVPVADPFVDRPLGRLDLVHFEKSAGISHGSPP